MVVGPARVSNSAFDPSNALKAWRLALYLFCTSYSQFEWI